MEFRNNNKSSRLSRAARLYAQLHNQLYYYFALCILSVSPVLAEGDTNNSSNPVAAATGNVTNQAVQFQNNELRHGRLMVHQFNVMDQQ